MIIRAFSVFEGVVYHCGLIDGSNPCRPTLEVEAVTRPGDVDEGPLLLPLADYAALAGGVERIRPCLAGLRAAGRIVDHLDVPHVAFPFWTPVRIDAPPQPPSAADHAADSDVALGASPESAEGDGPLT